MVPVVMAQEEGTLTQRQRALATANSVRTARRQMKEQIKLGELDTVELIRHPPAHLDTAKIGDVVEWAPGIGYWRAGRILSGLARGTVKVGSLGEHTRNRIANRLQAMLEDGWE